MSGGDITRKANEINKTLKDGEAFVQTGAKFGAAATEALASGGTDIGADLEAAKSGLDLVGKGGKVIDDAGKVLNGAGVQDENKQGAIVAGGSRFPNGDPGINMPNGKDDPTPMM